MAQRRMFNLKIIDTDMFLDMPITARLLYYDLSMRADDDGFIGSPKKIQRMIGCSDDDMKMLIAKRFIIPFDTGICVIKHWRIHNYIQPDRYTPTIYRYEKSMISQDENKSYDLMDTNCVQDVSKLDTQVRLGKVRLELGKDSKEKADDKSSCPYSEVQNLYTTICKSFPKLTKLSDARKKAIKARFNGDYTLEDFKRLFETAERSSFLKGKNKRNWSATFDWLIKDANMAKVLDGNYIDKKPNEETQPTTYDISEYEDNPIFGSFERR